MLDEILEKVPEQFNMFELFARAEEKTPFVVVALQECERMNMLTREMRRSLKEVDLGLKVPYNNKILTRMFIYTQTMGMCALGVLICLACQNRWFSEK